MPSEMRVKPAGAAPQRARVTDSGLASVVTSASGARPQVRRCRRGCGPGRPVEQGRRAAADEDGVDRAGDDAAASFSSLSTAST
jgi:hypothetical protein